jgi:hypothetical protein
LALIGRRYQVKVAGNQQQQQLELLHSRFVANPKTQLFFNTPSEVANAF